MKFMYSYAQIRNIGVLTMIDNEVYDICNSKFVDLKRNKIIHYDNLTNYYNETNARVRFFNKGEEPQITETTVLIDIDDESNFQMYVDAHFHQAESEDLTSNFINEIKGKPYILKK